MGNLLLAGVKMDIKKIHEKFCSDFEKYGPIFKWKIPFVAVSILRIVEAALPPVGA
jgi:hypothetical protein